MTTKKLRIWPHFRSEGFITEAFREAAVRTAIETTNKNAARLYRVSPSTITNWRRLFGVPTARRGSPTQEEFKKWKKSPAFVPRHKYVQTKRRSRKAQKFSPKFLLP